MKSGYHVELNEGQEHAEHKFEQLKETDVLLLGPDDFKSHFLTYLKYGEETPIDRNYGENATSPGDPQGSKVIAEQDASYCTLLLAFAESGDARVLHQPLIPFLESGEPLPEIYKAEIERVKDLAREKNGIIILTGTNAHPAEQRMVLDELSRDGADNIVPVLTTFEIVEDAQSKVQRASQNIQGICFIPKQLSADGRNKVILIAQKIADGAFEEQINPRDLLKNIINPKPGLKIEL